MVNIRFFVILAISFMLYWLIPSRALRKYLLIVSSFVWLGLSDPWLPAMVLVLTGFAYLAGRAIGKTGARGWIHPLSVVALLCFLGGFKYLGWLAPILRQALDALRLFPAVRLEEILLPLGISYIVFKLISYLTDVKWGLIKPGSLPDLLVYSSLFTIFTAGPIERFERLEAQLEDKSIAFPKDQVISSIQRICFGIFKKLVIADWIGYAVDLAGRHQVNDGVAAIYVLLYGLQLYFDFSAYSDIAIGSSGLFGIRIMENFANPYLAPNISQFWRRWHISLSDWIRDYVFFPLSRISPKAIWLKLVVPVIAMSLCGVWHGSTLNFALWGALHGLGLAIYQFYGDYKRKHKSVGRFARSRIGNMLSILITFVYVSLIWAFFKDQDMWLGLRMIKPLALASMVFSSAIVLSALAFIQYLLSKIEQKYLSLYAAVLPVLFYCGINTGFIYAAF